MIKKYNELLDFIKKDIIPQYWILSKCNMKFNEKENTYEYYIYYDCYMTLFLRNMLNSEILEKIYSFCEEYNCTDIFNHISVFVVMQ